MNELEWHGEKEFSVGGVRFLCELNDDSLKTNDERFILLKDRGSLETYAEVFSSTQPKTVLEFGIFQGGSPTLFSLWWDLDKFVGVDLCPPVQGFDEFCRRHPVGQRIRSHYGVSQTDKTRIDRIVRDEFGDNPLDVVIDDASHLSCEKASRLLPSGRATFDARRFRGVIRPLGERDCRTSRGSTQCAFLNNARRGLHDWRWCAQFSHSLKAGARRAG